MKKTLLAAALFAGFAGFAGAAQAETQVTLYGILDTGIQFANVKTPKGNYTTAGFANGVESGPRWGMKGTEDLGGGTQVTFQLESGYQVSNGKSNQGGRLFGRRAFLGLQNPSWGMVRVGRGPTISTDMFQSANSDPFGYGFGPLNFGTIATAVNTYRTDNQISYMSPVFAGFQFGAGYSFNVDDGATGANEAKPMGTRTRGYDAAATYTNGPLFLGITYGQTSNTAPYAANNGTVRQVVLDASYDFQVVRVYGAYVRGWNGLVGSGSLGSIDGSGIANVSSPDNNVYYKNMKQNAFMLGLSVPVGTATSIFATYQHQTLGGGAFAGGSGSAQNTFGVGAQYKLSKRTDVYAGIGYIDGYGNVSGQKETTGVVGMRHMF